MEKFICGKYDQLAQMLTAQGMPLYRLFRVAHPVIALPLDIQVEEEAPSYHILEQYMDKVLCGDGNEENAFPMVQNRNQLFSLLGVDGEGYDIALRFYEDLKQMGHFEELESGMLQPLPAAFHSVQTLQDGKTARKFVRKQMGRRMLFDAYSLELMPGSFYELHHRSMDPTTVDEKEGSRYLWLDNRNHLLDSVAAFDQALKKADYSGQKAIDRGLPQGRTRMGVQPDAEPQILFYPYYLAVLQQNRLLSFRVYDFRRLTEIPWLTQMYRTDAYQTACARISSLCRQSEQVYLRNPLCEDFPLRLMGKVSMGYGINCEKNTGNYVWTVQDWQVDYLVNTCGSAEQNTLQMLLENPVSVVSSKETGRTITALLTPQQKERLQAALDAEAACPEEIAALRSLYRTAVIKLGAKEQTGIAKLQGIAHQWPPAAFLLGILYLHGTKDLEKDEEKAYSYFLSAAEGGHLLAKMQLIPFCQRKDSAHYDPKEGMRYLEEAKKAGLSQAIWVANTVLEKMDKQGNMREKVIANYLAAAQCGVVSAMYSLAQYVDPAKDAPQIVAQAAHYKQLADGYELPEELRKYHNLDTISPQQ